MANTTIGVSSPTEKPAAQWFSRMTWHEAKRNAFFGKMMGKESGNIIQIKTDLQKNKGDVINFSLIIKLALAPVANDFIVEGHEEELTTKEDSILLGKMKQAVRTDGPLTEQRPKFDLRMEMKSELQRWFADQMTEWMFKKLSGTSYQGFSPTDNTTKGSVDTNIGEAGTTNTNILYGGGVASKAALNASSTFTPRLLELAKVAAKTGVFSGTTKFKMRPVMVDNRAHYVSVLHTYQVDDLMQTSDWIQAVLQARERAVTNPMFTGNVGTWKDVVIFEHDQIITGTNAGANPAAVRFADALFLGAQAGCFAVAQESPDWVEKTFNYGEQWGIKTGLMAGFDKATFDGKDFAVILLKTAAEDPTILLN